MSNPNNDQDQSSSCSDTVGYVILVTVLATLVILAACAREDWVRQGAAWGIAYALMMATLFCAARAILDRFGDRLISRFNLLKAARISRKGKKEIRRLSHSR